jgi:hypothetical protein
MSIERSDLVESNDSLTSGTAMKCSAAEPHENTLAEDLRCAISNMADLDDVSLLSTANKKNKKKKKRRRKM